MPEIMLLNQETIDKIAAGEVVERPSSVVKELVENAIDAKATAITVEIKEGGISFIRITDNGCGIEKKQVPIAFLRHSTSKIRSVEDLLNIHSLGFRGEALSSIAAVAQVELITKTYDELTGTRYVIEGSKEVADEEIGAPDGTTFIVRNLFYNVPARRKFLKTAQTEGGYISDLMERMALSHPDVSFKFINNGQTKLHTSGNGNEKDLIYHIYGRDITASVLKVEQQTELFQIRGFIGKPMVSRGNRNYENYFINGRYIKSALLSKAVEEAYKGFLMQHQYPFCVLYFDIHSDLLDVNVHPTKMELRFSQNEQIYRLLYEIIRNTLTHKDFIPEVPVEEKKTAAAPEIKEPAPEPFEVRRLNEIRKAVAADSPYEPKYPSYTKKSSTDVFFSRMKQNTKSPLTAKEESLFAKPLASTPETGDVPKEDSVSMVREPDIPYVQQTLEQIDSHFLTKDARKKHKIIGQLFDTYWLVEFEDKLFVIDQHAAHEKVLYEKTMKKVREQLFSSQAVSPPIILSLNQEEIAAMERYQDELTRFGYEIEPFGGKEYAITAIPADFSDIDMRSMFLELLNDFTELAGKATPELILEKVASMSCKAAVKGNNRLSRAEIETLIDELLQLDNPYNCPHGRPTIISMSKYEIEKKFKRIV